MTRIRQPKFAAAGDHPVQSSEAQTATSDPDAAATAGNAPVEAVETQGGIPQPAPAISRQEVPNALRASHVILLDRCRDWPSGTVLPANTDVLAALAAANAAYRDATPAERSIAGFPS